MPGSTSPFAIGNICALHPYNVTREEAKADPVIGPIIEADQEAKDDFEAGYSQTRQGNIDDAKRALGYEI